MSISLRPLSRLRYALLVTVSVLSFSAVAPRAQAADLPARKSSPELVVAAASTCWASVEGDYLLRTGNKTTYGFIGVPQLLGARASPVTIKGGSGYGGQLGFGCRPALSAWDYAAFVRYSGTNRKRGVNAIGISITSSSRSPSAGFVGTTRNRERHLVLDFQVGRDLGIGGGPDTSLKVTGGIRYANFKSTTKGTFFDSSNSTQLFPFKDTSRTWAVGPRLGLEGQSGLGNGFGLDYGAGISALYADRRLNIGRDLLVNNINSFARAKTGFLLGLDANVAITYKISTNAKFSLGYRADYYANAVLDLNSRAIQNNVVGAITTKTRSRLDMGPFVKLTYSW